MSEGTAVALGIVIFLGLVGAGLISLREREIRAATLAFLFAVLLPSPYLVVGLAGVGEWGAVTLVTATVAAVLILLLPLGKKRIGEDDEPRGRIDERDIMFSRNLLEEGTSRFATYYAQHPERRELDDAFRAEPGLLSRASTMYYPFAYSAARATEHAVEHLRPLVEGEVASERIPVERVEITRFLKGWVAKLGAVSVGVTELRDYHMYSTIGRGEGYGQPVQLGHDHAIAFAVEMSRRMVASAPKASIVMESYQQYLTAGAISIVVARFIRQLGYRARAHMDGCYRVVCPLVARDAGLGEIGRLGLLMTPELGPRVRLGVVTTDLPLVVDSRRFDHTVIDFCATCRKCAEACPSRAIPFGDRKPIDGVMRWQIDQEACFTLWCKLGTDCGRCVSVCPYSHPDNALHNLIRKGVRNSVLFRRLAIPLDDVFYGRRPAPAELPDWMNAGTTRGSADAA